MDIDIAGRLRQLRERHQLSQRALAKRAQVSNATISLVESGRLNPSIGNLKRILDGIPISVAEFFAMELATERPQAFFRAAELIEIGRDDISYRQVAAHLADKALQILHERFAPGADTGKIPLRHKSEEGGVVIKGRIELTVGDQVRVLETGDAYYFDSTLPHRFRNIGDVECELISACSPPSF